VRYYALPVTEDHAVPDRTMKPSVFFASILLCFGFLTGASSQANAARFVDIESGARHTCGLTDSGRIYCWGREAMGGGQYPLVASPVYRDASVAIIARGTHQGFAVGSDGKTVCWGENDAGQCDVTPEKFVSISGADKHACGVNERQAIYCWGADDHMNLSSFNGGTFTGVASGYFHSCGLGLDGSITCAGCEAGSQSKKIDFGQCDDAAFGPGPWTTVSAGRLHTCALDEVGNAQCIGATKFGQTDVPEGVQFTRIVAGSMHTCGIVKGSGEALCWGRDREGQAAPPQETFTELSAGFKMTCGLRAAGDVVCWGEDSESFLSAPALDSIQ